MRHVIVLLLVTVALVRAQTSMIVLPLPITRWYIHVVNGLSNDVALLVHCKSKDKDLGPQHLVHDGDDFQWNFKINVWRTTLFWCYFEKPGATVSFDSFWPESKSFWLEDRCNNGTDQGTCIWTAKDDGIYLRNIPQNVDELIHKWNRKPY